MDGNGSNLPLYEPKFNAYANADLCVVVKYNSVLIKQLTMWIKKGGEKTCKSKEGKPEK